MYRRFSLTFGHYDVIIVTEYSGGEFYEKDG